MSSNGFRNLSFNVKKLAIYTKGGEINITNFFEIINIYDTIFSPCMTGNIVLTDALGLRNSFHFDGSESIIIDMEKKDCTSKINKTFRIYTISNIINNTDNSETYTLHFVSDEWIKAKEKKIYFCYEDKLSEVVRKLLTSETSLGVDISKINFIEHSVGIRSVNFSGKNPINCILDCTKKAINSDFSPTYMFFENNFGYNFATLSYLSSRPAVYQINFEPKNFHGSVDNSLFGARKMQVIEDYNLEKNIEYGVHGARFVGFNIIERTIVELDQTPESWPGKFTNRTLDHNLAVSKNPYARVICFPTESLPGGHSDYFRQKNEAEINSEDDSLRYVVLRPAMLKSYTNTRIRLEMPGNFNLTSGIVVDFKKPISGVKVAGQDEDTSVSAKYLVIAARHTITYSFHETVIEIATNSTKEPNLYQPVFRFQDKIAPASIG